MRVSAGRLSLTLVLAGTAVLGAAAGRVAVRPASPGLPGAPAAPLPPPAIGTGAISGVVVDASTRQAIANAIVTLGPPGMGQSERQLADSRGRFMFRDLARLDNYTLSVQKLGYFDSQYGGPSLRESKAIALADGQWVDGLRLEMIRHGTVSGRVIDEGGEPVVGAYVRLLARILIAGRPQLAVGRSARTDDRGMYRITGLDAGTYYVVVPSVQNAVPLQTPVSDGRGAAAAKLNTYTADDPAVSLSPSSLLIVGNYPTPPASAGDRPQAYATTFQPSATTLAEAPTISLGIGEDRQGLDVQIRPVPTSRVAGRVEGASTMAGSILRLVPPGLEDLGLGGEAATAVVGNDGRFEFLNVPAGHYTLEARPSFLEYRYRTTGFSNLPSLPAPGFVSSGGGGGTLTSGPIGAGYAYTRGRGDQSVWARETIDLAGRDIADLVLTARRTATLSGRYVADPAAAGEDVVPARMGGPGAGNFFLSAQPAGGRASLGMLSTTVDKATMTFSISGLMPGAYVLRAPIGTIKSVMVGDKDYTNMPFDTTSGVDISGLVVTVTNRTATLTGNVAGTQKYENGVAVIAFPPERERWVDWGIQPTSIKSTAVSANGSYQLTLPGGDYVIVAVDGALIDAWQNPVFLEAAARSGRRVTVGWGEKRAQDLTVSEVR